MSDENQQDTIISTEDILKYIHEESKKYDNNEEHISSSIENIKDDNDILNDKDEEDINKSSKNIETTVIKLNEPLSKEDRELLQTTSSSEFEVDESKDYIYNDNLNYQKDITLNDSIDLQPKNNTYLTEEEKEIILRAILLRQPFKLCISLFDNKFNIDIKTRSLEEDNIINTFLLKSQAYESKDLTKLYELDQKAKIVTSLLKINGLSIFKDNSEYALTLDILEQRINSLNNLDNFYWAAILNAYKIYEEKINLALRMCNDDSFWKPLN